MYERPDTLENALLSLSTGEKRILAGGTDFYPALGDRQPQNPVVDISGIDELKGIHDERDFWRIGALATWGEIVKADLPPAFDGLKLAAREVGSIQIQNRATVAGNLCNASPAADGVPPLLTLDAEIQLTSASGSRCLKLGDFIKGNRAIALEAGEMVTAVLVPKPSAWGSSSFIKLGARKYLVISIAMVAARLQLDDSGKVVEAAVSVGACSAVAQRLTALEADLIGRDAAIGFRGVVKEGHLSGLSPIDDVRSDAAYRNEAAAELVERTLDRCLEGRRTA